MKTLLLIGLVAGLIACSNPTASEPESYVMSISFCTATLTSGSVPLVCAIEQCTVTSIADGAHEYVCQHHHFIIGADGVLTWVITP